MKVVLKIFLCIFLFILFNIYRTKDVLNVGGRNYLLRESVYLPMFYRISVCPYYCGDLFHWRDCLTIVYAIGNVEKMEYEDDTLKIYLSSKPLFKPDMYKNHGLVEKGNNFRRYKDVHTIYGWYDVLFLWD